jgi:hypothetical protein
MLHLLLMGYIALVPPVSGVPYSNDIHFKRILMDANIQVSPELSAAAMSQADNDIQEAGRWRVTGWDLLVGILPGIGMLPMLLLQWGGITQPSHLLFVPIICLVVAIYTLPHLRDQGECQPERLWTALGFVVGALLLYGFSVWNYSPFFSHLAVILLFLGWGLGRWTASSWSHVAAVTLVLATTVPWPAGLGRGFAEMLRNFAAWISMAVLDAFSIAVHISQGELRTSALSFELSEMVTYGSVFALLAISAIISLVRHRSFLHAVVLAGSACIWHGVAISGAILYCVWFSSGYTLNVQIAAFIGSVLALMLTDQFLAYMFAPVPLTDPDSELEFLLFNGVLTWPQRNELPEEIEDPEDRKALLRIREAVAQEQALKPKISWRQLPYAPWVFPVASALFLTLGIPAVMVLARNAERTTFRPVEPQEIASVPVVEMTSDDGFPPVLAEWRKIASRPLDDADNGVVGYGCDYAWLGHVVTVRLLFPYAGWDGRIVFDEGKLDADSERVLPKSEAGWHITVAQSTNVYGGRRYHMATAIGDDLQPFGLSMSAERMRRAEEARIPILRILSPTLTVDDSPTYRISAECETGEALPENRLQRLINNFEFLCDDLRSKLTSGRLEAFKL